MTVMGGDLWLDDTYDSGIPYRPGARFVVQLNVAPTQPQAAITSVDMIPQESMGKAKNSTLVDRGDESYYPHEAASYHDVATLSSDTPLPPQSIPNDCKSRPTVVRQSSEQKQPSCQLPEVLSILFVDDDAILRKLFVRAVRKVGGPMWNIQEASSGEMALQLCGMETFDLIFMDQYMASSDKQLLGTEVVRALRLNGVQCKICGLSANELGKSFIQAGADYFILKPMPCIPNELKRKLYEIMNL